MKAYILCFVGTIVFTFLAQISFKKKNKKLGIFMSIIAIFIPSFISGVREVGVGRDINAYVTPVLGRALNASSILSYLEGTSYVEKGYSIFIYIISRFSSNLEVSLFFIQIISCICVYIFAYKNREKLSMPVMMAVYLLVWYPRSYTIMRQSIAIGIILIGITFFNEKKYIKGIVMYMISILFHNSAILALPMFLIIYIIDSDKIKSNQKNMLCILIAIVLLVLVLFYESILNILSNGLGIISMKYYNYLDSDFSSDELVVSLSEILARIVYISLGGIFLIFNKRKCKDNQYIKYYYFLIMDAIFYLISFKMTNGERVGYYYRYIGMLYCVTGFPQILKKDTFNKIIINIFLCAIMFVFWYWKYPIQKNCETYPYRSSIVTWLN